MDDGGGKSNKMDDSRREPAEGVNGEEQWPVRVQTSSVEADAVPMILKVGEDDCLVGKVCRVL